jgi:abhydrolase domain-containing protein 12
VLSSGASDKIFILTFDYRGFGHSTGTPTEQGLITDAVSVVKWAMEVACVSPDRILLFSQSLGTAVATAAAEHFITSQPKIEFAGLMLCAAFTEAPNAFLDFSILGRVPLLAPLKVFPSVAAWYRRHYKDAWKTSDRLATLVQRSDRLRLTLFHATGDVIIPWRHCEGLFYVAANAANGQDLTRAEIDDRKKTYDLGEGGWLCVWTSGNKTIKQRIVKHGGKCDILYTVLIATYLHRRTRRDHEVVACSVAGFEELRAVVDTFMYVDSGKLLYDFKFSLVFLVVG